MNIDLFLMHLLNGSDNLFTDRMALVLTNGLTWTGLYLVLFYIIVRNNETMLQIGLAVLAALVCVAIASSVTDAVVKPLVARWRPNNDPLLKYTFDVVDGIRGKGYSFFSAHAANTMSLAVFFALLMRSRVLTMALIVWSLVNGWTRVYLGMHYPSDVLCGMLFGAVVGWGVYFVYRKAYRAVSPDITYISSQYTSTGYDHADISKVLCVLVFTLVYAVVVSVSTAVS